MDRLQKLYQFTTTTPFAWRDVQKMDPNPADISYVADRVPRGSTTHLLWKSRVENQLASKKSQVYYPTLIKMISMAICNF